MEKKIPIEDIEEAEFMFQFYKAEKPINIRFFSLRDLKKLGQFAERGLIDLVDILDQNGEEGDKGYFRTEKCIAYVENGEYRK